MKTDVVLAGVGGQGVLSIAAIIAVAAVDSGLHLKQTEVHGMSQRGGAVQSHLRVADHPIHSDLIADGTADLLISMEPMEALRYLPALAASGAVVTERAPLVNIPDYPPLDTVYAALEALPRVWVVDAEAIARNMRASRAANVVLLGAASPFLPVAVEALEAAIGVVFGRKGGAVIEQNIAAFRRGRAVTAAVSD